MNEKEYYEKRGNWDFSEIKCITEKLTNWDYFEKIKENSNEKSLCLDLGTGGGENVLKNYPKVGMIIGTDFSKTKNNFEHSGKIEKELFDEYVKKFKTDKGILLKRVSYGIVAKK